MKRIKGGVLAKWIELYGFCVFNTFPNYPVLGKQYVIQLTGVASRYVGYVVAAMLIILGYFGGRICTTNSELVLGGQRLLCLVLSASGVRIVSKEALKSSCYYDPHISLAVGFWGYYSNLKYYSLHQIG